MKGPDGFVQAYNVQVAVDELQLIVGQSVTQETNDKKQLLPMITTIAQQSGDTPDAAARRRGLLLGREPDRDRRHDHRRVHLDAEAETWRAAGACPRGPLPKTATIVDRMSRKLHTKAGAAVYAARKGIVDRCSARSSRRVASGNSCCGDSRRCKANGRWCARRTTFSSCIASACDGEPAPSRARAPADADAAIAEGDDDFVGAQHEGM